MPTYRKVGIAHPTLYSPTPYPVAEYFLSHQAGFSLDFSHFYSFYPPILCHDKSH